MDGRRPKRGEREGVFRKYNDSVKSTAITDPFFTRRDRTVSNRRASRRGAAACPGAASSMRRMEVPLPQCECRPSACSQRQPKARPARRRAHK